MAFNNNGGQAKEEAFTKKRAIIWRTSLLHVSTSKLQTMAAGKYPQVTPRSATAKERMNQLAVVCNLLLLAMIKNSPDVSHQTKKNEKPTYDPEPVNSHLYWLSECVARFDGENLLLTKGASTKGYQSRRSSVDEFSPCSSEAIFLNYTLLSVSVINF